MFRKISFYIALLYILTAPFYSYMPQFLGFSLRTYMLGIGIAAILITPKKYNEADILIALFSILAFGSLFFSMSAAGNSARTIINSLLMLLIIKQSVTNKKEINLTLLVFAISILLAGAVALNMHSFEQNRFTPLSYDPNEFGISVGASIIILLKLLWESNPIRQALISTMSLFALFFGFITYSRTMMISVAGAVFYSLRNNKQKWKILFFAVILIILMTPFYGNALINQITDLRDPSGSTSERILLLSNAIKLLPSYGIFGAGFFESRKLISATTPLSETYPGDNRVAHNMYLTIWLELGILGIAILISLLVIAFKTDDTTLKTLLVLVIIAGLLYEMELHLLFWLVLALSTVNLKSRPDEAV